MIELVTLLLGLVTGNQAAEPAAAQEEPLGRPAGWAVEDSTSLVTVAGGSALHLEPDPAALVLLILPAVQLPLVESRDRWVKVRYGDRVGWVDLEGGRAPRAAPPVRHEVAEPEPLAIGEGWRQGELGPYELFRRFEEPGLIDELGRVAGQHARLYVERYGLEVGEVAGSVLLFAGRREFLEFQRSRGHEVENRIDAYFHSPRTVVMYRARGRRGKLAASLIHELTHLLTWQALGAGRRVGSPLPPWLEEGMAEDLALSRLDRRDRLVASPLAPTNLRFGRRLGARLLELEQKIGPGGTAPALPQLLAMDEDAFTSSDIEVNYFMSACFVR